MVGGPARGWLRRIPCHDARVMPMLEQVSCDLYQEPTPHEIAAYEASVVHMLECLEKGICPTCALPLLKTGNVRHCSKCPSVSMRECRPTEKP